MSVELPGYPHLHFPGDWYIPPPHTSPANQSPSWGVLTNQRPASSAGARPCVCVGIRTKVLSCDQHRCGMMKSNILKWGDIFLEFLIRMKPEPVCFLLSDISMADWFFSFNFGSENTQHFICQMWDSLFEEKQINVWCIFGVKCPEYPAYFYSIKPFSGYSQNWFQVQRGSGSRPLTLSLVSTLSNIIPCG